MQCPRLAEDGADRGLRIEQGFDVGIIFGSAFDAAGGTERRDEGILPLHVAGTFEELHIFGVRAGPAAFDEGHAELIQFLRHADFVICRKVEAFGLCPIAQGGVVNLNKG